MVALEKSSFQPKYLKRLKKRKDLDRILKANRRSAPELAGRDVERMALSDTTSESDTDSELWRRPKPRRSRCSTCCKFCSSFGGLWFLLGLIIGLVIVSVVLSLHVDMKLELETLTGKLSKVLDEKDDLKTKFQSLHSTVQQLLANQTEIKQNVSMAFQKFASMSSQVIALNMSLSTIAGSLKSTPELKSLPDDVEALKKSVAQLGSRVTVLESKPASQNPSSLDREIGGLQTRDLEEDRAALNSLAIATKTLQGDVLSLEQRLATVGSELALQMQHQANGTANSLERVAALQGIVEQLKEHVAKLDERCQVAAQSEPNT